MNQQELEALLAQMGALGPGDFREETKQEDIPNPASTANGGLDPGAPTTIKGPVVYRTWVKPGTNQRLTVKVNADGTYTQDFSGADPTIKQPEQQTGTKEGDTRGSQTGRKREVYRGGKWVVEDNPTYQPETPKEEVNPSDPTRLRKPDGRGGWVDAGPNAAGVQAAADRAAKDKPVPVQVGGQWGYWDTKQTPPRWTAISNAPGSENKPVEASPGQWGYWKPGPDGTPQWTSIEGPKKPQIPSTVPPFAPDWSKPGLGIVEYAATIRARADLTDEQKKEVISTAHTNATATVEHANTLASSQATEASRQTSERGQNVSQANQRLSSSSTNFGNALTAAQAGTKYSTGPDAGAVLPYYLAQAAGQAQAYGGFNTPPAVVPGPAVQQIGQMGLPGQGVPSVTRLMGQGPWATVPTNTSAGMPDSVNPVAPVDAAGLEAANQAAQAGFKGAAAPLLAPTPPVILPTQNATDPSQNWVPSGPNDVNPNAVGMVQPNQTAAMLGAGPWQQPAQPTGAAGVMLRQAAGLYDPTAANQEALAMGFDPEIVALFGGAPGLGL